MTERQAADREIFFIQAKAASRCLRQVDEISNREWRQCSRMQFPSAHESQNLAGKVSS